MLSGAAGDVRSGVSTLRRSVDDLDAWLRGLTAAWTGEAAGSFAGAFDAWSRAAAALHDDLDRLAVLLDLAEGNYAEATRVGVRRWSGALAPADAVVPMGAAGGAQVIVSLPELAAAARVLADGQRELAGTTARSGLVQSAGMAGDDEALRAWRARYDAVAGRAWSALRGSVVVLGGAARGIVESGNAYVDADDGSAPAPAAPPGSPRPTSSPESAGATRLPPADVVLDVVAPPPPPSTGPGVIGPIPDVVAEFAPDVDPERLESAARSWRAVASAATAVADDADRALRAALATSHGPVFTAMEQYWGRVHVLCGTDTLLDLATLAPTMLAANLEALAEIVRWTQGEVSDAVMHRMPDAEATYEMIQGAKVALGFLGPVGRIGTRFVDAFEVGTRIGLARKDYLERVEALALQIDRSWDDRLDRAVAAVGTIDDVVPRFEDAVMPPGVPVPPLLIDRKQIKRKYAKHAKTLGVTTPRGAAGFAELQRRIETIWTRPTTRHIIATYRGQNVVLNYDPNTAELVIQDRSGAFVSGWIMNEKQVFNIVHRKRL